MKGSLHHEFFSLIHFTVLYCVYIYAALLELSYPTKAVALATILFFLFVFMIIFIIFRL